jgi:predicted RNA binding protein YcfA (HicA-like mRNA interferase family)
VSKLLIVDYKTMHRFLSSQGFGIARQKGSHVFYRNPDGRTTTVPNHGGRDLSRPLIREILREIDVTSEAFNRILNEL